MKLRKTEAGQLAFRERSALFSARQRSVYLLFDGRRDAADVLAATAQLGASHADVSHLVEQGFLAPVSEPLAPDANEPATPVPPHRDEDEDSAYLLRGTMF